MAQDWIRCGLVFLRKQKPGITSDFPDNPGLLLPQEHGSPQASTAISAAPAKRSSAAL
jgi:hypothetical protein